MNACHTYYWIDVCKIRLNRYDVRIWDIQGVYILSKPTKLTPILCGFPAKIAGETPHYLDYLLYGQGNTKATGQNPS